MVSNHTDSFRKWGFLLILLPSLQLKTDEFILFLIKFHLKGRFKNDQYIDKMYVAYHRYIIIVHK